MSKRTETERELLDALETSASRLSSMEAMLCILTDWDIYGDESIREEARQARRLHANAMIESMADLARHYHDETMKTVYAMYSRDG